MTIFFERRCQLPNELENATYHLPHEIMNMSYPFDYKTNTWSSCEVYDTNFTNLYYLSRIPANQSKHCDHWIYDKSETNSAVMEVNTTELISSKVVIWIVYVFLHSLIWCVKKLGIKVQRIQCWWSVSCWGRYSLDICQTSESFYAYDVYKKLYWCFKWPKILFHYNHLFDLNFVCHGRT